MNNDWIQIGRYAFLLSTSLLLAWALGSMELFEKTWVVSGKLTVSHIVRFLGYGGSLVMFGLAVHRLIFIFNGMEPHGKALRRVLLPLSGLIIAAASHGVLLLVVAPFLSSGMKSGYNGFFIAAILAAAIWLMEETVRHSRAISEKVVVAMAGKGRGESNPQW